MAGKRVSRYRMSSAALATELGVLAELIINTTNNSVHVMDAVTEGGFEQARKDLDNVIAATATLAGKMTAAQVVELTAATVSAAANLAAIAANDIDIATNVTDIAALAVRITALETGQIIRMATGQYTGDGVATQTIVLGFQVDFVIVWTHETVDGNQSRVFVTQSDQVNGLDKGSIRLNTTAVTGQKQTLSLATTGFVARDNSADAHPNQNTVLYDYFAIGVPTP